MKKEHMIAIAGALLVGAASSYGQMVNLSTRGYVGTGQDMLIAGVILDRPTTVIFRAIGPSMESYGVFNTCPDPVIAIYNSSGQLWDLNDDWQDNVRAGELVTRGFAPGHVFESALIVTLPAGNWTAIVGGFLGCTGIALVEVYLVQ